MRTTDLKRTGLAIATFVLLITVYACTEDANPVSPETPSFGAVSRVGESSVRPNEGSGASTTVTGMPTARAEAVRQYAWIGNLHNDAIRDFVANREQWVGKDLDNASRVCGGLVRLVQKYAPRANQMAGVVRSAEDDLRRAIEAVTSLRAECRTVATMSVFSASRTFSMVMRAQEGSADQHVQNFANAIEASDGSVAAVTALGNTTLNTASGFSQDDFDMLMATVVVADSSAYEWNGYAGGGGFGPILEEPMSVFKAVFPWAIAWKVAKVVAMDAIGCWAGSRGGGGWEGCATWALANSAGAVLMM